uniref:Opioid growth factor receptor (OGFr) conserved domain-containing protein n=1 Tax=viral metagenome TaxID=1070528 RepID=A0A6C0BEW5_9ZZZZ
MGINSDRNKDTIFEYNNIMLESSHDFIQWMFPTITPSKFNINAPVLTFQDLRNLRDDPNVYKTLLKFAKKMITYWCIFDEDKNNSIILNTHNSLRLSRMIDCLGIYGFDLITVIRRLKYLIKNNHVKPQTLPYKGIRISVWEFKNIKVTKILEDNNCVYGDLGDIMTLSL